MKTLDESWKEYRDSLYPDGMTATQGHQVQMAFYGGLICMLQQVMDVASLPTEEAEEVLAKLHTEAIQAGEAIMKHQPPDPQRQ